MFSLSPDSTFALCLVLALGITGTLVGWGLYRALADMTEAEEDVARALALASRRNGGSRPLVFPSPGTGGRPPWRSPLARYHRRLRWQRLVHAFYEGGNAKLR